MHPSRGLRSCDFGRHGMHCEQLSCINSIADCMNGIDDSSRLISQRRKWDITYKHLHWSFALHAPMQEAFHPLQFICIPHGNLRACASHNVAAALKIKRFQAVCPLLHICTGQCSEVIGLSWSAASVHKRPCHLPCSQGAYFDRLRRLKCRHYKCADESRPDIASGGLQRRRRLLTK